MVMVDRLVAAAKEKCEGCRVAWRIKDGRHVEPMPIRCQAEDIRDQIRQMEK